MSHRAPDVLAVVLNWNTTELTLACVRSLCEGSTVPDVLVVDNGSIESAWELLQHELPAGVRCVRLSQNVGFAGGMNEGLRRARAHRYDFVFLLNSDTVVDCRCVEILKATALDSGDALHSPNLVGPDARPQAIGAVWSPLGGGHDFFTSANHERLKDQWAWLTGTALFLSTRWQGRIGDFNEALFAYCEDVEWSFAAKRAGGTLCVVENAVVVHLGTQASGGRASPFAAYLASRNEFLLARRVLPGPDYARFVGGALPRRASYARAVWTRGERDAAGAILFGAVRGLFQETGPPPRRVQIRWLTRAICGLPNWLTRPLSGLIAAWKG